MADKVTAFSPYAAEQIQNTIKNVRGQPPFQKDTQGRPYIGYKQSFAAFGPKVGATGADLKKAWCLPGRWFDGNGMYTATDNLSVVVAGGTSAAKHILYVQLTGSTLSLVEDGTSTPPSNCFPIAEVWLNAASTVVSVRRAWWGGDIVVTTVPFVNIFKLTSDTTGTWTSGKVFVGGVDTTITGVPTTITATTSCKYWIKHTFATDTLEWGSGASYPSATLFTAEIFRMLEITCADNVITSFVCPHPCDIYTISNPVNHGTL